MLSGHIDLVKESKPVKLNEKFYVEKTYIDKDGNRAIICTPIKVKVYTLK